jgi:hypothetical protein
MKVIPIGKAGDDKISRSAFVDIRNDLNTVGVNAFTIFPNWKVCVLTCNGGILSNK